jgi:hypothetical protein
MASPPDTDVPQRPSSLLPRWLDDGTVESEQGDLSSVVALMVRCDGSVLRSEPRLPGNSHW